MKKNTKFLVLLLACCICMQMTKAKTIVVGNKSLPVFTSIQKSGALVQHATSLAAAIKQARQGDGILVLGSIQKPQALTSALLREIAVKDLKVFIEYPYYLANEQPEIKKITLERGVIAGKQIPQLDSMAILSINDHPFYAYPDQPHTYAYIAKVAGFDKAEYGILDTERFPFLFRKQNVLVSGIQISNWLDARFGPFHYWETLWQYILNYVGINTPIKWPTNATVQPSFAKEEKITRADYLKAVERGSTWYLNSKLLIAENWKHLVDSFTKKNGEGVVFPPVSDNMNIGNGRYGILEGHASYINKDGSQPIRWWIRGDCQAETAFALSAASRLLNKPEYDSIAINLLNYLYKTSNLRQGERNDPQSPSFGLIGWATTDPDAYYGDDNARVLLGTIGAATHLASSEWNHYIIEGILGNFRTAGVHGFRGPWFRDAAMQKTTWQALGNRNIINIHPHYESWLWALYLWLYDKTQYEPLKQKAKEAITITMNAFPEWKWTNGIQQEYARMLLPLAWLVRVENTQQHRDWLKLVALTLLKDMDSCGAIKERLGFKGMGRYGKILSNAEYGTKEAPLIAEYGDKVTDLLYTINYASFGLNEAYAATQDSTYKNAVDAIRDLFVRIQVHAPTHRDLDGSWFRAFDFGRWEYWASNADSGWGPWGTQTGWTQSWVLNALITGLKNTNYWDTTKSTFDTEAFRLTFTETLNIMLK